MKWISQVYRDNSIAQVENLSLLSHHDKKFVSPVLLGQVGTLLIHRLTHNDEIKSIQNHLDDYAVKQVKKLNQGEAVLTSVNLLHNLFIHVMKCGRKQHNETPML